MIFFHIIVNGKLTIIASLFPEKLIFLQKDYQSPKLVGVIPPPRHPWLYQHDPLLFLGSDPDREMDPGSGAGVTRREWPGWRNRRRQE